MSPKISIVIPTRNRADTLKQCLKTVLNQIDDNFEVVISDNSTDKLTFELIENLNDKRIIYVKTPQLLSMTDNWNFAFKAVTGDYVIYIGDDDGLSVNGLKILRLAISEKKSDAYKWSTSEYQWPIDGNSAKIISIASNTNKIKVSNIQKQAKRVMGLGGWLYYKLPSVYHAAIKKSVLDLIVDFNDGNLFMTTQPDLYSAMAIPQFCNEYVKINKSVTIQGRSARSNGGSSVSSIGKESVSLYVNEFGDYKTPSELNDLTFEMRWFFEPFYTASKNFDLYKKSSFCYTAMWAFSTRIGFIDKYYVINNFSNLKRKYNFSISKYLILYFAHEMLILRSVILSKNGKKEINTSASNIHEFSIVLNEMNAS